MTFLPILVNWKSVKFKKKFQRLMIQTAIQDIPVQLSLYYECFQKVEEG